MTTVFPVKAGLDSANHDHTCAIDLTEKYLQTLLWRKPLVSMLG
jgi:hypothetical protein